MPNSPRKSALPKNRIFSTPGMILEALMPKVEPERTGSQAWGRPRLGPSPHLPGLRSAPQGSGRSYRSSAQGLPGYDLSLGSMIRSHSLLLRFRIMKI
jgi:hypothetical protein